MRLLVYSWSSRAMTHRIAYKHHTAWNSGVIYQPRIFMHHEQDQSTIRILKGCLPMKHGHVESSVINCIP